MPRSVTAMCALGGACLLALGAGWARADVKKAGPDARPVQPHRPRPVPVKVPGVRGMVEPSVHALLGPLAARGETWVFARRWNQLGPGGLTKLEGALMFWTGQDIPPDGEVRVEILRLGLEEVEYSVPVVPPREDHLLSLPAQVAGLPPRNLPETQTMTWKIVRAPWARPESPQSSYAGKLDVKFTRETLAVSGRQFPCVVYQCRVKIDETHSRRERRWLHVDGDGTQLFPGELRVEIEGVVVAELVRIESPPAALPPLPDLSQVQAGQRLIWRMGSHVQDGEHLIWRIKLIEETHVVTRVVPDEVEMVGTTGSVHKWRYNPKRYEETVYDKRVTLRRENLSVGGRSFPCLVREEPEFRPRNMNEKHWTKAQRTWIHAGEDGVVRFPGIIKSEYNGAVTKELLRIEPPMVERKP